MPEGPECTRTTRQLNNAVYGKNLINLNFVSGRYVKSLPRGWDDFYNLLKHNTIKVNCVLNKGKFIYWDLSPHYYIYTTLGMTGNFKLKPSKHTRIAFYFDDDSSVYYNDQRNFGTIKFVNSAADHNKKLNSIGPDMLNNPCTLEEFIRIARRKPKWTLVKWVMDQSQISGVGNIYKSESLYLAGLKPDRLLDSCTDKDLEKLYYAISKILTASYESGGSTIRNYSDLHNNHGKYNRFPSNPKEMLEARHSSLMVYNQKEDIYGNPVSRVKLNDGRTTFWSPAIQN